MILNVKGEKYKIKFGNIDARYAGYCDKDRKIIVLSNDIQKKDIFKIISHEVGHAFFAEYKLDGIISQEMEEMVCLMLEDYSEAIKSLIGEKWAK